MNQQEEDPFNNNIQEDDDEEETLSLCDFPQNYSYEPDDEETLSQRSQDDHNRSSSPSFDFFEFFNNIDYSEESYMSHAEDIIYCGKLVPYYKLQHHNLFDRQQILKSMSSQDEDTNSINVLSRRYCESLPETNLSRSDSVKSSKTALMRTSRSLDCTKPPRRNSSLMMKSKVSDVRHDQSFSKSSMNNKSREGSCNKSNHKPSWHFIVFGGLVKVSPPEIDIRDMKHRQSRRSLSTFLPEMAKDENINPAENNRKGFWSHDLLKVLSCKSRSSVAFTEPSIVRRRHNFAV